MNFLRDRNNFENDIHLLNIEAKSDFVKEYQKISKFDS